MGSKKKSQVKARKKQQKDRERRLADVLTIIDQHGPRKKLPPVKIVREEPSAPAGAAPRGEGT